MSKQINQFRINDPQGAHRIDMLCLGIIYMSLFSCLIRSDYNFVIFFFVYFLWQQSYSPLAPQISLVAAGLSIIFDIFFAIIQIPAWTAFDQGNPIWQTLRGMHNFGIFCFVIILLLKLILSFFLFRKTRAQNSQ